MVVGGGGGGRRGRGWWPVQIGFWFNFDNDFDNDSI